MHFISFIKKVSLYTRFSEWQTKGVNIISPPRRLKPNDWVVYYSPTVMRYIGDGKSFNLDIE